MRIISKYKDFYDWVVFETDNRKLYNRVEKHVDSKKDSGYEFFNGDGYFSTLYFCNKMYIYLFFEDKYYWNYNDVPEEVITKISKHQSIFRGRRGDLYDRFLEKRLGLVYKSKLRWGRFYAKNETNEILTTDINKMLNCPVVIAGPARTFTLNPKLVDMGFNKVLSPIEVYQDIYNFIPYIEPDLPGGPNDMDRYEAKGFDKKTSFRPKMK